MVQLRIGDVFRLSDDIRKKAKTEYEFAVVTDVSMSGLMIEAEFTAKPKDVRKIKNLDPTYQGRVFTFIQSDVLA
ncbi:hypothetical protein WSM22_30670 [Cytophagales bacterium WSM2-2]|nr:hypothetical protein WSM22_30670 [Cytophagales bacterium WSM2-2]